MSWKRMQLFEVADWETFPAVLRFYMVAFLDRLHEMVGSAEVLGDRLSRVLEQHDLNHVQDFCSGNGGLARDVFQSIRQKQTGLTWTMSDKFPQSLESIQGMDYLEQSIDVTNTEQWPKCEQTLHTIFCAFHHFTPAEARQILEHSQQEKLHLCVFEMSNNAQPKYIWWLAILSAFVTCLILTPTIKGVTLKQLLFTYLIPILPICIAWDGAVSNARTYTKSDLEQLIDWLDEGYIWTIEEIVGKAPMPMLCLWGSPQ